MQFTLPEQSNWYNNMPIHLYRPYCLTRLQGARKKFGVVDETMSTGIKNDEHLVFTCKLMHMGKQWTQGVLSPPLATGNQAIIEAATEHMMNVT